jgi:large subunit ribosomal protein L22
MEIKAVYKYSRMSPSKVGDVTRLIQGMPASRALDMLRAIPRKSARLVEKTLKAGIANAMEYGRQHNATVAPDALRVKLAVANEGPRLKRFQPKARGSAGRILKRLSHIQIILTDEA